MYRVPGAKNLLVRGWLVGWFHTCGRSSSVLTLVSEEDRSCLRPLAVEADGELIAVASHHQPPHQNGLIGQHGVLARAHIFKCHLVSLQQIHIHYLMEKQKEE